MSTHLETIIGEKQSGLSNQKEETSISLTRFWGGDKGSMLQITMHNHEGYIQLTQDETIELAKVILNAFDTEIYPSE